MPELPEVHTTATELNRLLPGKRIIDVWSSYNSPFHFGKDNIKNKVYFSKFRELILNKKIIGIRRRAKNVLIDLSGGFTILVHMKMTGHLLYGAYKKQTPTSKAQGWEKESWRPSQKENLALHDPFNRFIRFVISLSNNKQLVLSDMRKFAKVLYFETEKHHEDISPLGPEPLDTKFTIKEFHNRLLKKPNGKIKQVLMDQAIVAGIGNIYSDEMLWLSSIHPARKVDTLSQKEISLLYTSMKHVLTKGIDFKGDSMSDYRMPNGERGSFQYHHKAYRQTGKECSKKGCSGKIARIKIGGRSAHFCTVHQK
jgi:formamidopyrimidine-DNA glycosylase